MSKKFLFFIVCLNAAVLAIAGGSKDTDTRVADPASWKETVDINNKKPGKYNFYVEAGDLGGNVKVAGPFNMYIDPESDLPIVGITNPRLDMRVPGNLNVVGTCVDDDAVDYVEIVLDGNAEAPIRAEGKEFWSYYLDTREMAEGAHVLSIYGVDINGLKGKPQTVTWHLDRKKPQSAVDNQTLGALVAGKMTLTGTVFDGNGIDTLYYSLDRGENFIPLKFKVNKKTGVCSFALQLDTKKMPDGPSVCWFKAKDKQGSTGFYTFLFYVDNTNPDVRILYPEAGKAVNGKFTVAGYAGDTIGLQSLGWRIGKETGSFDLTLGNPWWVKEFDIRGQNVKVVEVEITAVDTSGNKTSVLAKIPVDQTADLPTVQVAYPAPDAMIPGSGFTITGTARDDDGLSAVLYSIDGGAAVETPAEGMFHLPVAGLSDGKHSIAVWAKDSDGTEGPRVTLPAVVCAGKAPAISLEKIALAVPGQKVPGEAVAFAAGMEVNPESDAVISGSVVSGSALKEISWQFGSLAAVVSAQKAGAITGGSTALSIPVPADVPYGPVILSVTATDIHDRATTVQTLLRVTDLTKARGDPAVVFEDVRISAEGTVTLDAAYPLSGYLVGGNAVKATLSPASKIANVIKEGNSFKIVPTGVSGSETGVTLTVETDRGFKYVSRAFNFVVPGKQLDLSVNSGELRDGAGAVEVTGSLRSDLPVQAAVWRLLSATSAAEGIVSGDIKPDAKTGAFSFSVDPASIPEGPSMIEVRAEMGSLVRTASVPVYRAPSAAPAAAGAKPLPPAVTWIEGGALYYFVSYAGTVQSPSVTVDGAAHEAAAFPFVGTVLPETLTPGAHTVVLKVVDEKSKPVTSTYKYTVKSPRATIRLDSVAGAPWVSGMQVALPRGGDAAKTAIAIVESADPVTACSWTVGSAAPARGTVKKGSGTSWELSFPLPALVADRTAISVSADVTGQQAVSASGVMIVVRAKDASQVNDKEAFSWSGAKVRADGVYLVDTASPLVGLYSGRPLASVTLDKPASGITCTVSGYTVSLSAAADGPYGPFRLVLTDVDGWTFRTEPFTFLADSDSPALAIEEPANGLWVQNSVRLKATLSDRNKIVSREYSIDLGANWQPLDSLDRVIDLSAVGDGAVAVMVRATDEAGRVSVASVGVNKDTVAPAPTVIVPAPGEKVNGEIRLGLAVDESGRILKAEYQKQGAAPAAAATPADAKKKGAAPAPAAPAAAADWVPLAPSKFLSEMVGTAELPLSAGMKFRFTDAAGNSATVDSWPFTIDQETDLPVAEIHLPEENEVISSDFVVSGVVYDDDRAAKIWYRIDNNKEIEVECATGYSIPIALGVLTDNEHSVTVYAEDVYGVKGKPVTRAFRVSLEEPKAEVLKPSYDQTNKGLVEISGTSSDKNGIQLVQISVDNGNSWGDATGTENWKYAFDSKIVQDGTHVVFVKVWDKYGIEGLYSSLINVDNSAPDISLELPLDGSRTVGPVFISGQTTDNIDLRNVTISFRSLSGTQVPAEFANIKMEGDIILTKAVDLSALADGLYNVDVSGEDAAGNLTRVSRNFTIDKKVERNRIENLYPLNGQHLQGTFRLYGEVFATDPVKTVTLFLDNNEAATAEVTGTGYYSFLLGPDLLSDGMHTLSVRSNFGGSKTVSTHDLVISYQGSGPWITIDNLVMGDFAFERPWLKGSAGYVFSEADKAILADKKSKQEDRDAVKAKKLAAIEISFDNGKTFEPVEFTSKGWQFRVETQDMAEGYHFMIARAKMGDGSTAVTRTIIQIDKTSPVIRLISPGAGGRYNQSIDFSGLASDDINLSYVSYALRKGDKASYELPGFIQGLYFDGHFWGATMYDVGVGLTFFDDNVKLQVQYGQFTQEQWSTFSSEKMRFGGDVFGAKLLANLLYLPASYFLGPDFSWLSASMAVGANFSRFSESQSGQPQILSAVVGQLEFPRVTFAKRKMLRTFSLYTEAQLWFIPTDVSSAEVEVQSLVPHITGGVRVNVF